MKIFKSYCEYLRNYFPEEIEKREREKRINNLARRLALEDGFFMNIPHQYKEQAMIRIEAKEFVSSIFN